MELKRENINPFNELEKKDVLTAIRTSRDISEKEIINLIKRDFISKINLIKSAYPNLDNSLKKLNGSGNIITSIEKLEKLGYTNSKKNLKIEELAQID